jgi:hypothetical protein
MSIYEFILTPWFWLALTVVFTFIRQEPTVLKKSKLLLAVKAPLNWKVLRRLKNFPRDSQQR